MSKLSNFAAAAAAITVIAAPVTPALANRVSWFRSADQKTLTSPDAPCTTQIHNDCDNTLSIIFDTCNGQISLPAPSLESCDDAFEQVKRRTGSRVIFRLQ